MNDIRSARGALSPRTAASLAALRRADHVVVAEPVAAVNAVPIESGIETETGKII
jgi:hypothetical protein